MNRLNQWLSWGLILILGLLLGVLGFSLWDKIPSPAERVAWLQEAQWIGTNEPSYRFYTRHTFSIEDTVQTAWVRISADNNFIFYVNGKVISRQVSTQSSSLGLGSRLSDSSQNLNDSVKYRVNTSNHLHAYPRNWKLAVYVDLTPYLKPGQNTIALEIQKAQKNPRLVVEGAVYTVPGAVPINLTTGAVSWKASTLSQNHQRMPWYHPDFPDQSWPEAKVIGPVKEATYSRLSQHLFDRFLQGTWITGNESPQGEVWLRSQWQIPSTRKRAFIRLAGNGEYSLLINGLLLNRFGINERNQLHMYEVTNFLHTGVNILAVRLTHSLDPDWSVAPNGSMTYKASLGFFLDGWVETAQNTITAPISTDSTWSALKPVSNWAEGSGQGKPALILSPPSPQEFQRQFEGNGYLLNYPNYLWHISLWCLEGMGCAFVWAWGLGRFFLHRSNGRWDSFMAGVGLLLPGTLFLIGIGLLKHRYAEDERGLLFVQPQSTPLILLGFVEIVLLTLLWSQMERRSSKLGALLPRWGLLFLLGLIAFTGLGLAAGIAYSWSPSILLVWLALDAIAALTLLPRRIRGILRDWFTKALQTWPSWGQWFLLVLIIGIGFGLRAYNLDFTARDSDENTSLDAIRGILRTGAPVATSGIWYTRGPFFHYMVALWLRLVGDSDVNARFLSVLFGTATLVLVFILSRYITGKVWLSLLVTAILAIDPWELLYSRNIRFYQLQQLQSLITFWVFSQGFIEKRARIYQYFFFIILTLMLLTQEVSITLLPCFLIGFLIFYRPFKLSIDWSILLGSLMTLVIYIFDGIVFSILCLTPWILLSSTTETQLKLHLGNFTGFISALFCGNIRMYTLYSFFFLLGFIYFLKFRNYKLFFWFSTVFITIIVVTLLVVQVSIRYAYGIYPFFIILSVHSAVCIMESLGKRFESILKGLIPLKNIALGCVILLLISNIEPERVLAGYQDTLARHNPQVFQYIREHRQPGDLVFGTLSSAAAIDLGGGIDYYMPPEEILRVDALYLREGRLIDRWGGGVSVINLDQLSNILEKANRLWLQLDDSKPPKDYQLLQLYNYIQTLGQPVLETYGVRLRLWKREDGLLPHAPNRGQDLGAY